MERSDCNPGEERRRQGRGKTRKRGSKMAGDKESWESRSQRKCVERQKAGNTGVPEWEARDRGYRWGRVLLAEPGSNVAMEAAAR